MFRSRATSGFTSVETMIAASLLVLVLGGVGYALQRSLATFEQFQATADLNGRSARALQRVVAELLGARLQTLAPQTAPPFATDVLTFERAVGIAAGAPVWGPEQELRLELEPGEADNGVDDDGDGSIDERRIVLLENPDTANEIRVVLVNGVSELLEGETDNAADDNGNGLEDEAGLAFSFEDGRLTVRLTVERSGPGGVPLRATQEASIVVRNRWEP